MQGFKIILGINSLRIPNVLLTIFFYLVTEHKHLGSQLEEYVAKLPIPTRVVRTPDRVGLIRARYVRKQLYVS